MWIADCLQRTVHMEMKDFKDFKDFMCGGHLGISALTVRTLDAGTLSHRMSAAVVHALPLSPDMVQSGAPCEIRHTCVQCGSLREGWLHTHTPPCKLRHMQRWVSYSEGCACTLQVQIEFAALGTENEELRRQLEEQSGVSKETHLGTQVAEPTKTSLHHLRPRVGVGAYRNFGMLKCAGG
jgi:hypothetical protein